MCVIPKVPKMPNPAVEEQKRVAEMDEMRRRMGVSSKGFGVNFSSDGGGGLGDISSIARVTLGV